MPPSTPDDQDFIDDHVSLGLAGTPPPRRDLGSYSATDDIEGVLIYTHGASGRVSFNIDTPSVLVALARCGWTTEPSRTWKFSKPRGGTSRYVLRGSKWIDERAPANRTLPFARRNEEWKTRIYSLAVETTGDNVFVDMQVVRQGDIARFFEGVIGLKRDDYKIDYYRTIERFFVLPPHEGFRFAQALGELPVTGRGRQSRKRFLVKSREFPITIRTRAKTTAQLVVYRIDRGATAAFKVELRLRGRRHDRAQFHQADVEKLDMQLLDLIDTYKLKTIPKPVRWEPRTFGTRLERGAFDANIQKLPQKAWRGAKISRRFKLLVELCHTPHPVRLVSSTRKSDAFPPSPRIRTEVDNSGSSPSSSSRSSSRIRRGRKGTWECKEGQGLEVSHYVLKESQGTQGTQGSPTTSTTTPRDPWMILAQDIRQSRLYVHEVILDHEQTPRQLLAALTGGTLGRVGVAGVGAVDASGTPDLYGSVREAMEDHPFDGDDLETLVIVVDASATLAVAGAVVGNVEPEVNDDGGIVNFDAIFKPGPLMPPPRGMAEPDILSALFEATGAWLWDMFEGFRRVGEETGLKVIVVTIDGRPDHGRGALEKKHFFTDGRVRSSIGDAGRYFTHQRYLVQRVTTTISTAAYTETIQEGGKPIIHVYDARVEYDYDVGDIIAFKDEGEGQPGRLIYKALARPPRHRWRRKSSS